MIKVRVNHSSTQHTESTRSGRKAGCKPSCPSFPVRPYLLHYALFAVVDAKPEHDDDVMDQQSAMFC